MKSRKDVITVLANFYGFAKYMVKDFDSNQPMLWTALLQIEVILRSPEGRRWGEYHCRHPEAFHNIAMDMQQILNARLPRATFPLASKFMRMPTPMLANTLASSSMLSPR
jgi:hypothetical protein